MILAYIGLDFQLQMSLKYKSHQTDFSLKLSIHFIRKRLIVGKKIIKLRKQLFLWGGEWGGFGLSNVTSLLKGKVPDALNLI